MAKRWPLFVLPVLLLGLNERRSAAAEPSGCPPDEWFCDEGEGPPRAEPDERGGDVSTPDTLPAPGEPDPDAAPWTSDEPTNDTPSINVHRAESPPATEEYGTGTRAVASSPWNVNLRVQGILLDEGRGGDDDVGLGGVGASLRYRVNPVVTLDIGVDSIIGTDHNGYDRAELMFSFSSFFYLNRHPSVRTYLLCGLNSSTARVDVDGDDQSWSYFGGHAGLGLEIPLDRRVALNFDLVGFVRGRTDARAAQEPEFTDDFGRVTNIAGGGIFRVGVNLFW